MNLLRRANPSLRSLLSRAAKSKQTFVPRFSSSSSSAPLPHTTLVPAAAGWRRFHHTTRLPSEPSPELPLRFKILRTAFFGGSALIIYYYNREPVPYTRRPHLVALSRTHERLISNLIFQPMKFFLDVLPPYHPYSVRVQCISNHVIKALQCGPHRYRLHPDHLDWDWEFIVVSCDWINAYCMPGGKIAVSTGMLNCLSSDAEVAAVIGHEVGHAIARHNAELLTHSLLIGFLSMPVLLTWTAYFLLAFPFSQRLEMEADYIGLLLLASAGYHPRVAIEVHEKFAEFEHFGWREYLSRHYPRVAIKVNEILWQVEYSGWREHLARYHHTVAVKVHEKLMKLEYSGWGEYLSRHHPGMIAKVHEILRQLEYSDWSEYLSTHPPEAERGRMLSQPEVMDEALSIYREVAARR